MSSQSPGLGPGGKPGKPGSLKAVLAMGKDLGLGIQGSGCKGENTCMALAYGATLSCMRTLDNKCI